MSHPEQPAFDTVKAKALLEKSGKSMASVARALGYERQTVGHWFRGRGEPDVNQMKAMAKELGCHWVELLDDDSLVVYQADELIRVERMRNLDAASLVELDAFLSFKAANKDSN